MRIHMPTNSHTYNITANAIKTNTFIKLSCSGFTLYPIRSVFLPREIYFHHNSIEIRNFQCDSILANWETRGPLECYEDLRKENLRHFHHGWSKFSHSRKQKDNK